MGKAYDGMKAAELVAQLLPDILITDINMPCLSGIDLLRRVKKISPDMGTLVISGYSDFAYAKSALSLGVTDYLVKPFMPDELKNVLDKMQDVIEKRIELAENLKRLKKEVDDSRINAQKSYLKELVMGTKEWNQISAQQALTLGLQLDQRMYCICLTAIQPMVENLTDLIGNKLFPDTISLWNIEQDDNLSIFVFGTKEENEVTFFKDIQNGLSHMKHSLSVYYNTRMWCTVGNIYRSVRDLPTSYREARAIWKNQVLEESIVCYGTVMRQMETPEAQRAVELENRLLRFIMSAAEERAMHTIEEIVRHYGLLVIHYPEFVSVSLVKLVISISELKEKANKDVENGLEMDEESKILNALKRELSQGDLQKIEILLQQYVKAACIPLKKINLEHSDHLVVTMKQLIEDNLSNENFSLESAASQLYFSANYIRQLFKQKTGESFVEYLIKRRMELAKKLLVESDLQIQKIAELTGYSNSRYFASCFKKYFTVTPSEYRAKVP